MSTLSFPASPSVNDVYTFNGKTWIYTGAYWALNADGSINDVPIGNTTANTGNFTTLTVQTGVSSNLIPTANVTYDLGSSANRWNDLWLANSTIHIGGAQISASGTTLELPATVQIGTVTLSETGGNLDLPETISANTITATTTTTDSLTVNSNAISADNGLGFRNRIINGDMRIDQRNAGAAVTASGTYPVDRFIINNGTDGSFSAQQDSSAPAGFVNSVKITTTTADGTLTTTQNFQIYQAIEGTNVADLGWGTANAQTITISFWVRSSLTGTFGGSLRNSALDRSYAFTYSISSADTWEQKSVTIAGDTSGTWLTTTGTGIYLAFGLGVGPDRSGTAGSWAGANYVSATGATSVIGTLNATWYVTGVQLEVGSVATPFERRPYGMELALCQRYYAKLGAGSGAYTYFGMGFATSATELRIFFKYPQTMRASPTINQSSCASNDGSSVLAITSVSTAWAGTDTAQQIFTVASGLTTNRPTALSANNSTSAFVDFSAEL